MSTKKPRTGAVAAFDTVTSNSLTGNAKARRIALTISSEPVVGNTATSLSPGPTFSARLPGAAAGLGENGRGRSR